jgi:hypothetical protein
VANAQGVHKPPKAGETTGTKLEEKQREKQKQRTNFHQYGYKLRKKMT